MPGPVMHCTQRRKRARDGASSMSLGSDASHAKPKTALDQPGPSNAYSPLSPASANCHEKSRDRGSCDCVETPDQGKRLHRRDTRSFHPRQRAMSRSEPSVSLPPNHQLGDGAGRCHGTAVSRPGPHRPAAHGVPSNPSGAQHHAVDPRTHPTGVLVRRARARKGLYRACRDPPLPSPAPRRDRKVEPGLARRRRAGSGEDVRCDPEKAAARRAGPGQGPDSLNEHHPSRKTRLRSVEFGAHGRRENWARGVEDPEPPGSMRRSLPYLTFE